MGKEKNVNASRLFPRLRLVSYDGTEGGLVQLQWRSPQRHDAMLMSSLLEPTTANGHLASVISDNVDSHNIEVTPHSSDSDLGLINMEKKKYKMSDIKNVYLLVVRRSYASRVAELMLTACQTLDVCHSWT